MIKINLSKKPPQTAKSYYFVSGPEEWKKFTDQNLMPLPTLTTELAQEFLDQYNKIVDDWSSLNVRCPYFSSLPFALQNQWQSSFYHAFESMHRLRYLLKILHDFEDSKNSSICLVCTNPEWLLFIYQFLQESPHIPVRVEISLKNLLWAYISLWVFPLRRIWIAGKSFFYFLGKIRLPIPDKKTVPKDTELVVTSIWFPETAKNWKGRHRDPFLGDFPYYVWGQNKNTVLLYHLEGQYRKEEKVIDQNEDLDSQCDMPSINIVDILSFRDIVSIIKTSFMYRYHIRYDDHYPYQSICRDIARSLQHQMILLLISYKATKNILKTCPKANFLSLYENNCWESGVHKATHDAIPYRKSIGFQHTALSPSFLKMKKKDLKINIPDHVITCGTQTKIILNGVMRHDSKALSAACALRQNFWDYEERKKFEEKNNILVLLQGAPTDIIFLRSVLQRIKDTKLTIRIHPTQPVDLSALDNQSYQISYNKSLYEDCMDSSAVLYNGTSAAIEALYWGIPVIYVDNGEVLSSDPLFKLEDCPIKLTWLEDQDFESVYQSLMSLDQSQYEKAVQQSRKYGGQYFVKPEESELSLLTQTIHKIAQHDD